MNADVEKGEQRHKDKLLNKELEKHRKAYMGKLFKPKRKTFAGASLRR